MLVSMHIPDKIYHDIIELARKTKMITSTSEVVINAMNCYNAIITAKQNGYKIMFVSPENKSKELILKEYDR